ncbi:hypothetical protein [Pseudomonas sp. B21-048]|uniref:hypothetical protein n=1 Tax=Pseudomonas sp. B21-048 TaxID=2895490 RepID=UPI00215E347B|nr:hypothetical protein [Pseudomonas sp. B21-048]UVK99474.1 hypothetical protein LOY56_03465 [Pseudomonas sp. B21-048]
MTKEIEQRLERIHHELSGSERDLSSKSPRSLKYHVQDIQRRLSDWLSERRDQQDKQRHDLLRAMVVIGVIGVILAITRSAASDMAWVREHTLAFRLWGVSLCLIFVGVLVERSSVVRSLWSFAITKFLLSLILSGVVFYARGRAAGYINGVFHVDASALPITLILTTGLVLFKLLVPFVLIIAALILALHALRIISWVYHQRVGEMTGDFLFSMLCSAVAGVILFFGWSWPSDQLSDTRIPEKVYLIAEALDFNLRHECANVDPERPVIFLGAGQESVLVAPYRLEDFDFATFFETRVTVPTHFVREKCEYKPLAPSDPLGGY